MLRFEQSSLLHVLPEICKKMLHEPTWHRAVYTADLLCLHSLYCFKRLLTLLLGLQKFLLCLLYLLKKDLLRVCHDVKTPAWLCSPDLPPTQLCF